MYKTKLKEEIEFSSVKDVADKIGISRQYLYDILNDKGSPTVEILQKITNFLNLPITIYPEE